MSVADMKVLTLEEMMAEIESESKASSESKPSPEEIQDQFEAMAREVIELRKAYENVRDVYTEKTIALLQFMWRHGIQKQVVDDIPLTAAPQEEIEYDSGPLSERLKLLLSDSQWEECFEPQPPKIKKRGINKFLKLGGLVADVIREHQTVVPVKPTASKVTIGKPKGE